MREITCKQRDIDSSSNNLLTRSSLFEDPHRSADDVQGAKAKAKAKSRANRSGQGVQQVNPRLERARLPTPKGLKDLPGITVILGRACLPRNGVLVPATRCVTLFRRLLSYLCRGTHIIDGCPLHLLPNTNTSSRRSLFHATRRIALSKAASGYPYY